MNKTRQYIESLVNFDNYDSVDDFASAVDEMEAIKLALDSLISKIDSEHFLQDYADALLTDLGEMYGEACYHVRNWNAYEREFKAAKTEVYS